MINLEENLYSILELGKDPYEYYKIYNEIIDNALKRGLDKSSVEYYTEIHHIFPRTLGGNDVEGNYAMLTFPEHVVVHILLHLMYPDNDGLLLAAVFMTNLLSIKDLYKSINDRLLNLEVLSKMKKESKEKWYKAAVCCSDSDCTEILKIYYRQSDVEKDGFSVSHVSNSIHGVRNMTGGYYWKRLSDVIKNYPDSYKKYCDKLDSEIKIEDPRPIQLTGLPSICCNEDDTPLYIFTPETAAKSGFDWERIKDAERGKSQKTHFGYKFINLDKFKELYPEVDLSNLPTNPPKPKPVIDSKIIIICKNNGEPISYYSDKKSASKLNPIFTVDRLINSCKNNKLLFNKFKIINYSESDLDLTKIPKDLNLNISIVILDNSNNIIGYYTKMSDIKRDGFSIIPGNKHWMLGDEYKEKFPGKLEEYLKDHK